MSFLFTLISMVPGLLGKFFEWQTKKLDTEVEGFKTASGVDLAAFQAHLAAQVEVNKLRLAQQSWWGAKTLILLAGVPATFHFALVMLDSSCPATWHWNLVNGVYKGGCGYGFTALPTPYDTYQWAIVQSFFIVMPVQTGVNAVSQWLARRR